MIYPVELNTEGPIYMGSSRNIKNCDIAIFGVPYDGTTSFNPGTRFGPNAIRLVSNSIETYCPHLEIDLEDLKYADIGSLNIPHKGPEEIIHLVESLSSFIGESNIKPLMLGGEHSITIGSIKALSKIYNDLIIVHLDAHADMRNEWLGSNYNHACTIRRCLEEIESKIILQLGIRSGTKTEFEAMNNLIEFDSGQSAKKLDEKLKKLNRKNIYLTIDVDWFDPSVIPGTGTPEPGGYYWKDFISVIKVLQQYNIIGADIVELSPKIDSTEISSIFSAKITRSLISLLSITL
tara:strand:- start:21773 stop:22648 length:876 start_codon:yes stop_codon:yes gene_type:complete